MIIDPGYRKIYLPILEESSLLLQFIIQKNRGLLAGYFIICFQIRRFFCGPVFLNCPVSQITNKDAERHTDDNQHRDYLFHLLHILPW